MRTITSCLIVLAFAATSLIGRAEVQGGRAGVTIVEEAVGNNGEKRLTVFADSADLPDLLKKLFEKTGEEFAIDQDVAGLINLKIKSATPEQVLARIAEIARPPLVIRRDGKLVRVQVNRQSIKDLTDIQSRNAFSLMSPNPGVPRVIGQNVPLVTLDVPNDKPISLADALARISAQVGAPIKLDPRVPRSVTFTGRITRADAILVLQTIAQTSGLKFVVDQGTAWLTPTDQFTLRVNGLLLSESNMTVCTRCGQRLSQAWTFCPYCGQRARVAVRKAP